MAGGGPSPLVSSPPPGVVPEAPPKPGGGGEGRAPPCPCDKLHGGEGVTLQLGGAPCSPPPDPKAPWARLPPPNLASPPPQVLSLCPGHPGEPRGAGGGGIL